MGATLLRVDELASAVPSAHIALTLTLYVTVYLLLLVAFVRTVVYMAGKPADLPAAPAPGAALPVTARISA